MRTERIITSERSQRALENMGRRNPFSRGGRLNPKYKRRVPQYHRCQITLPPGVWLKAMLQAKKLEIPVTQYLREIVTEVMEGLANG